ncbi:MAG: protein kinase [Planctomycetes bacterium]|nr:protein kinase [Planctomycetota bacterium]
MTEDRLLRYVRKAIELQDAGETVDLAELCRDAPDLLDAVRETLALDDLAAGSRDDGLAGKTLNGRYRLGECIGIGAMGAVYEARDLSLERTVAVKVLPPGSFGEQKRRERFRREAQALAALKHPNIVPVHDHGQAAHGLHYLVMERLRGCSLARVVSPTHSSPATEGRRGVPPTGWLASELGLPVATADYIPQVVHWLLDVVAALRTAHEHGICHRDVKPSNIFLTEEGNVVLLDFGIAARRGDASMTTKGSALGTPAYMAPEQIARDEAATPAMDVYGVCATLYHLIAMQPPYAGDSIEVLARLQREEPKALLAIDPRLPRDLCAIVEKGLERDPRRRYRDMVELEADLRAFLAHLPVKARPITRVTRAWRHLRRRPIYFVAGMALAAIALALFVPPAWREAEARARTDHARLFATVAASLAVEGSVERRLEMDRDERAGHIAQLDAILALREDDVYSRTLRAALHQDQGNTSAAAADIETIARTSPTRTAFLDWLVARYRAFPASGRGVGDLDLADPPAPETDLGRFLAAFHHWRRGDAAAAQPLLAAAPTFFPARYLNLGVALHLAFGENEREAHRSRMRELTELTNAVQEELGGPTARTCYFRGTALMQLEDLEAARLDLERSRALQPEAFGTLCNLGLTYRDLHRLDDAATVLQEAIALRPWNLNASLQLIDVFSERGEFDAAEARLEQLGEGDLITEIDRLWVRTDIEIGRYLYHLGRDDREATAAAAANVIAFCERARELLPPDDEESRQVFAGRAVLVSLAIEDPQTLLLELLDQLEGRPLNSILLDAAADLLGRDELRFDGLPARILERVRKVLASQARNVPVQPK